MTMEAEEVADNSVAQLKTSLILSTAFTAACQPTMKRMHHPAHRVLFGKDVKPLMRLRQ